MSSNTTRSLVKMEGLEKLQAKLKELPTQVASEGLRRSTIAAADVFVSEAKRRVPYRFGDLFRSITRQIDRHDRKHGFMEVSVGPDYADGGNAAHLVEFQHRQIVNGKDIGRSTPTPFMRPAWDASTGKMLKAFNSRMLKFLLDRARRK